MTSYIDVALTHLRHSPKPPPKSQRLPVESTRPTGCTVSGTGWLLEWARPSLVRSSRGQTTRPKVVVVGHAAGAYEAIRQIALLDCRWSTRGWPNLEVPGALAGGRCTRPQVRRAASPAVLEALLISLRPLPSHAAKDPQCLRTSLRGRKIQIRLDRTPRRAAATTRRGGD